MTTFERIMQTTGREITECQCQQCKNQCRTPCLGTPDDIIKLAFVGYAQKLRPTLWMVGMIIGAIDYPIPMIQPLHTPFGCVFFKHGNCELHDLGLKPTEGKLSYHSRVDIVTPADLEKSLTWQVAREWIRPENERLIREIFKEYQMSAK